MALKDLIALEQRERNRFEAYIHGVDIDGGQIASGDDPTQGSGTDAWQQAQRMQLELNAQRRRN